MTSKTCSKCEQTFPATSEFFYCKSKSRDGLGSWCKACERAAVQAWYEGHKKEVATYNRVYRKGREKEIAAVKRVYREAHAEEIVVGQRAWAQRNREHLAEYNRQRYQTNLQFHLGHALACDIGRSLHGCKGGRHWESLVGYTLDDLIRHLEARFQPGMSWENYGKGGWEIDHIVPVSFFHFESTDDSAFKQCWALSNLQPLWATDNYRKGARESALLATDQRVRRKRVKGFAMPWT